MTQATARDRESIELDLHSTDDEIRRLGVERLLSLPAADAIPRLVGALGDESWRVRKAAVERLVACSEVDRVADALVGALADGENPGRRNAAVEALVAQGGPVVPKLVDALATDDIDVRKLVVDALAGIGDPSACDAMIRMLADPDANVRAAAADALGALGGDDASRALLSVAVAENEEQLVAFSALRALARLECPASVSRLGRALDDPILRPGALALIGFCEHDEAAVEYLLKALSATSRAPREAAMAALLCQYSRRDGDDADALAARIRDAVRATDDFLPQVVDRLETSDLGTRLLLIQFLGLAGAEEGVVPMLRCARDEAVYEVAMATLEALGDVTERALDSAWTSLDGDLRRNACVLFGRTRGASGSARLAGALGDPDGELRAAAARALGERGAVEVLPELVRRLEATALDDEPDLDDELDALAEALIALVAGAPEDVAEQAVLLLDERLQESSESVRAAAARVFTAIGRPADVARMTQLLKDPSAQVRRLAVEGLTRIGADSDDAAELLHLALADESPLVRVASAAALGASKGEAIEDLARLVRDEDARVRAAALRAIAAYCVARWERLGAAIDGGDPAASRAMELLGAPLSGDECDGMVRMAALEAIDRIGGEDVAALAATALDSDVPEVVQAAVGCIGRHGDDATVAELIALVQHPAWAVRADAIQTLGERRLVRALPAILRRQEIEQDGFVRDAIERAVRVLEE